jgi:hypothetical protein
VGPLADPIRVAAMTAPQVVKVMWAIPNMGYTNPLAYDNRLVMAMRAGATSEAAKHDGSEIRYEHYLGTVGRLLTPYAREVLAEKAVQSGMDLLFWIDDDMLGDPDVFGQLAASVVGGPADICGALAFTRNPPHEPVLYTCIDGFDRVDGAYFVNTPVKRYPKDALVEVDAVGYGAVVERVSLLTRMKRPWFMSTCGSGEDVYHCYQAKKVGARIFSDTRVKLGHVGNEVIVTEETYETYNEVEAKRARDGDEVKYPQPWEALR